MDAQQFLAEFGHIANAPGGLESLRELVISIAMQGKLVEQDKKDQPASELLNQIKSEKQLLLKNRKVRQSESIREISVYEIPYSLPASWRWARIGEIGNVFNGNSINAKEKELNFSGVQGRPYIATKDVG